MTDYPHLIIIHQLIPGETDVTPAVRCQQPITNSKPAECYHFTVAITMLQC